MSINDGVVRIVLKHDYDVECLDIIHIEAEVIDWS